MIKKILIRFFFVMYILADDRQISLQIKNSVPIVDTLNGFYPFQDDFRLSRIYSGVEQFFLNDLKHWVYTDENTNRIRIGLSQYNHFGYAGFSRFVDTDIHSN